MKYITCTIVLLLCCMVTITEAAEDLFREIAEPGLGFAAAEHGGKQDESSQKGILRKRSVALNAQALRASSHVSVRLFDDVTVSTKLGHSQKIATASVLVGSVLEEDGTVLCAQADDQYRIDVSVHGRHFVATGTAEQLTIVEQDLSNISCGGAPHMPAPVAGGALVAEDTLNSSSVVDVMIVYSANSKAGALSDGTTINLIIANSIASMNQAFQDSGVDAIVRLVHTVEVAYTRDGESSRTILDDLTDSRNGMESIGTLRDTYGADLVCYLGENFEGKDAGTVGLAWVNSIGSSSTGGFSIVEQDYAVGNYTFAHELGHNLGCAHDHQSPVEAGAFSYSYGHRWVASSKTYASIMHRSASGQIRVGHYSNPNITHTASGGVTGVAIGQATQADNETSIENMVSTISAFRPVSSTVGPSIAARSLSVMVTSSALTQIFQLNSVHIASGTLTYSIVSSPLQSTATISSSGALSITPQTTASGSETMTVKLNDGYVDSETVTLTINYTVTTLNTMYYIEVNDTSIQESGGTGTITVKRVGDLTALSETVTISYAAPAIGIAGKDEDFSDSLATSLGQLTFAAGESQKNVTITAIDDSVAEDDEEVAFILSVPQLSAIQGETVGTMVIVSDEKTSGSSGSSGGDASSSTGGSGGCGFGGIAACLALILAGCLRLRFHAPE